MKEAAKRRISSRRPTPDRLKALRKRQLADA